MYDAITKLADELAFDIFEADGGVDDFREMDDAQIAWIVHRELVNRLAESVMFAAKRLQKTP